LIHKAARICGCERKLQRGIAARARTESGSHGWEKDFFDYLIEPAGSDRIYKVTKNCAVEPGFDSDSLNPAAASFVSRFPEDLRMWLKGPALLRLAQGAAQDIHRTLRAVFSLSARRFHHPWRMLALLTYAFASGIWHSCAIAEVAALDPDLVALCHGEAPSADVIRRFRNQNRMPILSCLELLLRRLWCHRHDQRVTALHSFLSVEILCDARLRLQRAEQSELPECAAEPTPI
jgi:hypothetical protein